MTGNSIYPVVISAYLKAQVYTAGEFDKWCVAFCSG